ncbi:hypothetical protein F4825DRAFT_448417 [Nemania diffusa]|nr:hypothetical protein F4825DRAFT_448417 [Nemania diffusa]
MQSSIGPPSALQLWYVGERGYDALELELRVDGAESPVSTIEENPDCNIKHDKLPFSAQHHFVRSTVHYLHRTTRDFIAQDDVRKLLDDRLVDSTFDSYTLAVRASIALQEVELRVKPLKVRRKDYGHFGGELAEKEQALLFYLESCQNDQVRSILKTMLKGKDVTINHKKTTQRRTDINGDDGNDSEGEGEQPNEELSLASIAQRVTDALKLIESI